jgi:hypothetical protein
MANKIYPDVNIAIAATKAQLYNLGMSVQQDTWQSIESPDSTWELINHSFCLQPPQTQLQLAQECRPNLPWAESQFQERIAGNPVNPGDTFKDWPHYKNTTYEDDTHRVDSKFSHTYMERFWPRSAGRTPGGSHENLGIRYSLGDLEDMLNLMKKHPLTRQAYLPIWFPEDTGTVSGQRVPCSLGYSFIVRSNLLHLTYFIRSCDYLRHFKDDVYMAIRLQQYVRDRIQEFVPGGLKLGLFTMHIISLHVFSSEKEILRPPQ